MFGIACALAYLICAVVAFRFIAPRMIKTLYGKQRSIYEDLDKEWKDEDRKYVILGALAQSLFWPVTFMLIIPAIIAWDALMSSELTRSPIELAEQERAELDRLRKLAREYGLPMGDEK